ncbi:hypothetical protein COCSUDRAFT_56575 [Coccomyxa subellipsoidea C-169]|uniref:Uncharacterized protein n=1 Tax=Coccomyxa subellipsoidea (strain C-169) TaxID=574566 RepID=I0YSI7_COCSC|nr:hypothetical protein COCSUDRAFT_56575 [Coccomyxa subellipsoidea C-169]EIE21356.1 hypothetical protein COCSUDRAFT_56575 [Coccomyxa subellipsoidea C-169]|eukprot:XP_005645900.1 hypothetical protein COCSUDRAFT_56575 [Coccomyxa subellipsoidea C-169]
MARNLPQKKTKYKNPHKQAAGKKHVRKPKQRNEAPILGDDDDFGDFTAPDTVDDGAAFSGRVQLDDEDAFEMAAGNVDTQQAAAGSADQAKAPKKTSKKRKQPGKKGDAAADGDKAAAVDGDTVPPKKKKKKVKRQPAAEFEAQRAVAADIAGRHPAEQAAWLQDSWRACSGASALETEALSEAAVVALPAEGSFEERLKAAAGEAALQLTARGLPHGSPAAILVSSAAMGAVGLIKMLPGLNKECRIAKLFAKHFKVAEQQKLLEGATVGVASGTPNRLCKLADLGALKTDHLQLLVVDVHLDAKQRTILDIPETRGDFWDFFAKHVAPGTAAGRTKVVLIDGEKLMS